MDNHKSLTETDEEFQAKSIVLSTRLVGNKLYDTFNSFEVQ